MGSAQRCGVEAGHAPPLLFLEREGTPPRIRRWSNEGDEWKERRCPKKSVLRLDRDEALEAARLWQECGDAREFACRVLGGVMNALMDSEAQQMCGASRNERSDGRENSRNGYRPRSLKTAVGDVELEIPKLRHGTYYPEGMLARWSRVDTSVASIVQEMYVCGVSTRKVERVASKLGISSLSSSEVSSLCSDLDAEVEEFRRRDLSGTPCCYLWLDATYMSCRGRLVGRLAGRRDRDRAGRRRAQALPGLRRGRHRARTPGRHSSAGCASAGWPAFASWSPTATPGSWPPSRACSRAAPGSAA